MNCNCPVCNGKDPTLGGVALAEKEVIPFFKVELLKLKYPKHPFPLRYDGLLSSILCYSQALHYNRVHNIQPNYYTKNKWLLKYSGELFQKFGMKTFHESELKTEAQKVCEYNVEVKGEVATINS